MLLFEIIVKTIYYAEKTLDTGAANIFLVLPIAFIFNFFINVQWYFYIIFIVIVIDIITALLVAALKNKEKIESNKFFNSIIKLAYYFVIMFFVYLIDYFIIKNSYMLINLVSIIILINELISIDENVCKLLNRKTALTKLFKLVEKLYYEFVERFLKNKT